MSCTLYSIGYHILLIGTIFVSLATAYFFVMNNIPRDYDNETVTNLLNGKSMATTCNSGPFSNKHSFSYSLNGNKYVFSCPYSLPSIIKTCISFFLMFVVQVLIIYFVMVKRLSWMTTIVC